MIERVLELSRSVSNVRRVNLQERNTVRFEAGSYEKLMNIYKICPGKFRKIGERVEGR